MFIFICLEQTKQVPITTLLLCLYHQTRKLVCIYNIINIYIYTKIVKLYIQIVKVLIGVHYLRRRCSESSSNLRGGRERRRGEEEGEACGEQEEGPKIE